MQNKLKAEEIPQPFSIKMLREWLMTYKKQKKKAAFLYGPTGTGKTSSVYALAEELGYEVIEVNSSDYRNAKELETTIGQASSQQSLFGNKKILLVDEVDGIAGNEDRGGVQALLKIIEKTRYPIIMTATGIEKKIKTLGTKSLIISYAPIPVQAIQQILQETCKKQGKKYDENAIKTLARISNGDIRAALHDLTAMEEATPAAVQNLSIRDKKITMTEALNTLFLGNPAMAAQAFDNTGEDIDQWFLWIQENLPRHYSTKERAEAYTILSKADVYRGRIRRQQYWRMLSHITTLLTTGISAAKKEAKPYAKHEQPTRLLAQWMTNQKNAKKKSILQKIAATIHCGTKKAITQEKLLIRIAKKNIASADKELKLEEEEKEWLSK